MHVKPLAYHFPWRNRLIAALSDSLVVIEAAYKSGTMITVNECLELSVPIYCVPTAFQDENIKGVIILLVMVPIFWWILKMLMISRIDKMKFLMFYIA